VRPCAAASTFHFRWLLGVGLGAEGWSLLSRDWPLTRSIAALTAVAALAAVGPARCCKEHVIGCHLTQ